MSVLSDEEIRESIRDANQSQRAFLLNYVNKFVVDSMYRAAERQRKDKLAKASLEQEGQMTLSDGTPTSYERLRDVVPIPAQMYDATGLMVGCGVCGQMSIFRREPTREELVNLAKDMWRCIQVTPMAPPALKESIR